MQPRGPRTALLLIAVGFFALGIASVVFRPRSGLTPTPSAPAATPAPADASQETVLILGVDDLQADEPRLEAVWVAAHRPPGDGIFLFGLPLDAPTQDGGSLESAFGWDADSGPDEAFVGAVARLSPIPTDFIIVLDETAFAALIDLLGGVELNGAVIEGRQVLGVMEFLAAEPSAALEAQRRLLEALAARAESIGPGSELQPLVDLVPAHAYVSIAVSEALTRAAPFLPLTADRIHISLPLPSPAED